MLAMAQGQHPPIVKRHTSSRKRSTGIRGFYDQDCEVGYYISAPRTRVKVKPPGHFLSVQYLPLRHGPHEHSIGGPKVFADPQVFAFERTRQDTITTVVTNDSSSSPVGN